MTNASPHPPSANGTFHGQIGPTYEDGTTTLCSPTRTSLLTGRNHHSVGMRMLSNFDTGFNSGRGRVTKTSAMLPEVLRDNGFNTMAVSKWHLAPMEQTTASGPYTQWPLSRGFERYYGFLEAETDSFYP